VNNLAARLRSIVKQDASRTALRELTYVPDVAAAESDIARTAEVLGGVVHRAKSSACVVVEHVYDAEDWHGRRKVGSYALEGHAPLAFLDQRLASTENWSRNVVFFDIETTGLSGGAGTLPLLAACGWFEDSSFRVRQLFLNGPAGEHALLESLRGMFDEASLLVTYNGRTFDVPVMETRWAYHRQDSPSDVVPHLDMLPTARRLWARRDSDSSGCTLSALERSVLRFHRWNDVPGLEIPSRYFQFLRTGDPACIRGVIEHNRHDVISLAALTSHALWLVLEGADACEHASEQLGLGRIYEMNGDMARAERALTRAASSGDRLVAPQACARLAGLFRRTARHSEAAAAWQDVLALTADQPDDPLQHRAAEALAIHHEHRVRDLETAKNYAVRLRERTSGSRKADADRRLGRLDRKLKLTNGRAGLLI